MVLRETCGFNAGAKTQRLKGLKMDFAKKIRNENIRVSESALNANTFISPSFFLSGGF
jgi:hypothetical protein